MGYALLIVIVFMTGAGQNFASKHPTMEACQASLAQVPGKVGEHNATAAPPDYIAFYSAACAEIKNAPKGKDA